jgi:hypothetical protein
MACFYLTGRDGHLVPRTILVPSSCDHYVESAQRRWPPVVAAHVGWPPLSQVQTSPRKLLLTALLCVGRCFTCCCLPPTSHPELSNQAQRRASSLHPSCTKSLPAAPASEARPRDFPAVIFLHEHLTGGSLLPLFPYPTDPATSSVPPWSSCPTSSLTASTTPSAPHWCPLPVGTRAAAESPPPVSTPFPASPPRFSCSDM